jgi:hypothetical protein
MAMFEPSARAPWANLRAHDSWSNLWFAMFIVASVCLGISALLPAHGRGLANPTPYRAMYWTGLALGLLTAVIRVGSLLLARG